MAVLVGHDDNYDDSDEDGSGGAGVGPQGSRQTCISRTSMPVVAVIMTIMMIATRMLVLTAAVLVAILGSDHYDKSDRDVGLDSGGVGCDSW